MQNKDIKVEWKDPKSLKPHPKNRNKHPKSQIERLAQLLEYQGWRLPIIVSKRSGCVVAGHGRLEAALLSQMKKVPVAVQDFEDADQEYAFMVSDNSISEWADLDLSAINDDLADFDPDFNLDMLGFEDFALEPADKYGEKDADDTPDKPKNEKTKNGELWHLSHHKLFIGDGTLKESYINLLGNEKIDLVVTDPPYNVAYNGKTKQKMLIKNDNMDEDDFFQFLYEAFEQMANAMKPGAAYYIFHADSKGYHFRKVVNDCGLMMKQCLIWVKNNITFGRNDYHWKHEPILYGWKPGASHQWSSDRKQTTVWEFGRQSKNLEHPMMKPVDMICYAIKNSSKANDIILDPFSGSGSTLIAAEKTSRSARCMELDPKYADVILQRWAEFTELDPVRDDGKRWSDLNA